MKKIQNLKTKIATFTAITVGTMSANAALPPEAQAAMDGVTAFNDDMISNAWTLATVSVLAAIGIKLFRKWTTRSV
jgi:hypothetical protein